MDDSLWRTTTSHGESFMKAFVERHGEALLAFDFDGTLAPIVDDPEDSRLHEGSAAALAQLGPEVGRMAIVTGRGVDAVRRLGGLDDRQGLDCLVVLGQYGVERWDAATGEVRHPDVPSGVAEAWDELQSLVGGLESSGVDVEGLYLEDKQRAFGVHTRRAKNPQALMELLEDPVRRLAERHDLQVEPGRFVLEVRAASGDKGDALRELVEETRPSLVAMVGDDLGDIPAFEVLEELQGAGTICARVVSGSTEQSVLQGHADISCDGPDGVAQWLEHLVGRIA
ncbi:trehalose-phosphatase [Tessaracoccus antarcticus]|uniref:Trehalose 6-phosphate phosphatase n=1 Tax=Tessaracoccus antarcticus TaxID=2479848 RepID=A0A3M0GFT2_9ACTN|nr:trehalose-phosphatase [Tessaracoccus antarcticus]RMB59989.1 trehalose-phosphatase [Tessaracoccus antarcticus]